MKCMRERMWVPLIYFVLPNIHNISKYTYNIHEQKRMRVRLTHIYIYPIFKEYIYIHT